MKLEDKFDIKVFILFLLNNLEDPLAFNTINDIVLQDGFVNYFDFAFCFSELLENGQVEQTSAEGEPLYRISEAGRGALESYEGSVLGSVKERALRSALRLLAFNRSGNRIHSKIEENGSGFTLSCNISDKEKTLFCIEVFLTERHYAEKLKENFDERAEIIYRGALSLLSGDVNFIFEE